jgi:SAM-dependent methyltransferase
MSIIYFEELKRTVGEVPLVGPLLRRLKSAILLRWSPAFTTSEKYWEDLYVTGGNSGPGSYNEPARFKATVLNAFVQDNHIKTVLEWGCGDGNQLGLAVYPRYVGVDVSKTAVSMCREIFASDHSKRFFLIDELPAECQSAECTLSLDVVYHLVEDEVYFTYMKRLFASATRFVIIYAWNVEEDSPVDGSHVRHRAFLKWVGENINGWALCKIVRNDATRRRATDPFAHFYIFSRQA